MIYDPDSPDRLDSLDKEEFWPVAQHFIPSLTYEEYSVLWDEFCLRKHLGLLEGQLH